MSSPQKLSGPFAGMSGVLMLLFSFAGFSYLFRNHGLVYLYIVLAWATLASAMMIYWGIQAGRKYLAAVRNGTPVEAGIGHPTLEMIGGVSAAVIASVTLVILFASSERAAKIQTEISCAQMQRDHPKDLPINACEENH